MALKVIQGYIMKESIIQVLLYQSLIKRLGTGL